MKKSFYQVPDLQSIMIAVERGFTQTSNIEDPVVNPEKDW
jgi:hypothetical protein